MIPLSVKIRTHAVSPLLVMLVTVNSFQPPRFPGHFHLPGSFDRNLALPLISVRTQQNAVLVPRKIIFRQKSPVKQKESSLDFLPRKERNRRLIQRSGIPRRASFASEPEVSADTSRLRPDTPILATLHRARSSTPATPARFFVPSRESPRYSPSRSRQTPSSSHRTC